MGWAFSLAGGGREGLNTRRQVGSMTFLHLILFCFVSEWENGSVQKAHFAFFKVMKFYLGLHNSKESKWIFDESLWTEKAKFFKPWSPDTYPFSLSLSIYLPQRNVVGFFVVCLFAFNKKRRKAVYTTNTCTLKYFDCEDMDLERIT